MSRWNLCWLLGLTAAALVGVSITYSIQPSQDERQKNIKLLADVLSQVEKKYAKELDQKKMRELIENMINGGLEKLDPHSGFMGVDEYKAFRQGSTGKFGGVGIRLGVDPRSGQFLVESPIAGTPAYEAGIVAGDLILKVDGKALDNWDLRKVVENIQGDPGTDVTLTVLHEGHKKPVDIKMTRAEIKIESVMGDHRDKLDLKKWDFWIDPQTKIAYIRINTFTETTVDELIRVVDGLQKAGMRGLVMDLRTNPGGLLTAAAEVASMFLPQGKRIVSTKGRNGEEQDVYNADPPAGMKPGTSYPIAILLNRYSACANGRVQTHRPRHVKTTALKLTTASYWRPSGRNIHRFPDSKEEDDWGVKPDKGYEIKLTDEERLEYFKWRRDRDILRRNGEEKPPENGKKEFRDKVLDKAVEYIRGELAKQAERGEGPAVQPNAPAANVEPRNVPMNRSRVAGVTERRYRDIVR
jgi:carboxyl-terminal processing protease